MFGRSASRSHQLQFLVAVMLLVVIAAELAIAQGGLAPSCNPTRTSQVPPVGEPSNAVIQRATSRSKVANCQLCPAGSEAEASPFDCTCHQPTIPQLKEAGLDKSIRFNIRYATLNAGTPATTKNLIVAFAGQNGASAGSVSGGGPGNLTGQPDRWSDSCNDANCGSKAFDGRSLVGRLLKLLGRPNTHALVFLDQQYDWGRWYSENEQIANGITNYLKSLVSPSVVKNIVVAGHSRGGCLTLTVSRKLRADPAFRNIRLIVLPLDAVCNPDKASEENWASRATTDDNPIAQTPGADLAKLAAAGEVLPLKGDFDNDGRDDFALLRQAPGWNTVPVAFAQNAGGWRVTNNGAGDFAGLAASRDVMPLVGDFNTDGREDIALLRRTAGWRSVPIAFAIGNGAWSMTNGDVGDFGPWAALTDVVPLLGDYNQDGRSDIALLRRSAEWNTVPIAFAQGNGSWLIANKSAGNFPTMAGEFSSCRAQRRFQR